MKSMLKFVYTWGACCIFSTGISQHIQPAVQQGHFSDIVSVSLDHTDRILTSIGLDGQLIQWDLKTGMQLNRKHIQDIPNKPDPKSQPAQKLTLNDTIYEINGPLLTVSKGGVTLCSKTTEYFDLGYSHLHVQQNNPYIFASSYDGKIYVYDKTTLKTVTLLKAHQSSVNKIVMAQSGNALFTASSDRTIIEWDTRKLLLKRRFHGHSFRITAVLFNTDGSSVFFGNEIGEIKEFDLTNHSQELKNYTASNHPVKSIHSLPIKSKEHLIITTLDNNIRKFNKKSQKFSNYRKYHNISWKQASQKILVSGLGLYLDPSFEEVILDFSPSQNSSIRCANEIWNRKRRKLIYENLKTGKKKTIRSDYSKYKTISAINDSLFAVFRHPSDFMSAVSYAELSLWKVIGRKTYYYGTNYGEVEDIASYGNQYLFLLKTNCIVAWDMVSNTTKTLELHGAGAKKIWIRGKYCLVWDYTNKVKVYNLSPDLVLSYLGTLSGHSGVVTDIDIHEERKLIATASEDATLKFWSLDNFSELSTLIPVSRKDFILLSPSGEYQITKNAFTKFGFSAGTNFIYPDQFDLQYNKPHLVSRNMGIGSPESNDLLEKVYLRRLKKMGFENKSFQEQGDLPELSITNYEKLSGRRLVLHLSAFDKHFPLDRINVLINDVRVYGSGGLSLSREPIKTWEKSITLDLIQGKNKIEVSVLNDNGVESIRQSLIVEETEQAEQNLYMITLGASTYLDERFNLTYPHKDAEDLANLFSKRTNSPFVKVHTLTITNEDFTTQSLVRCRDFLKNSTPTDVVVLFFAGHGVLDEEYNYYLASYDMNLLNPAEKGIAYEELESLLDGIAPLRKVLFIDACHSGELDKEDVVELANYSTPQGDIVFRNSGAGIQMKQVGLKSISEMMGEMYTDLRKGTGATVISSSGGFEFAMESAQWKNGLFTYCLLHGLKDQTADLNKDGKIMISELHKYLSTEVSRLSKGAQKPTSRIENKSVDFRIW